MRILFVDDEPHVLAGLRRMLRPRAREWSMLFAGSGTEALALAAEHPVDVVVSDMRMPEMDGATLLTEMRSRHPDTVRIVLSGHSDVGMSLRSAQVAHQFLGKPCDPEELTATVERACALRDRLGSPALRRVVGDLAQLPSPPVVINELNALLDSDLASLDEVAGLVSTDPALSAKLLQLVNSAFFGLGHRHSSLRDAVGYLGLNVIRNLAVASSAHDAFAPGAVGERFLADERAQALDVSSLACELLPDLPRTHDAFVAGLLHDIGNLVLATSLPDEFEAVRAEAPYGGRARCAAELHRFGTTHAEVGAYLLSLWGLPSPILEAVALHHDADALAHRALDVVHVTCVATAVVESRRAPASARLEGVLDPDYLAELGIGDVADRLSRSR